MFFLIFLVVSVSEFLETVIDVKGKCLGCNLLISLSPVPAVCVGWNTSSKNSFIVLSLASSGQVFPY